MTELLPLIDAVPKIKGRVGAPASRPRLVLADRGYDSQPRRAALADRGIRTRISRRRKPHGTGPGVLRYVVEQAIALLHQFRRLRTRFDRRPEAHEAFMSIGCSIVCSRRCLHASSRF